MAQHYKKEDITKSRVKVFLGWENFNPLGNVPPNRKDQNLASRLWTSRSREAVTLSVASPSTALTSPTAETLQSFAYRPAAIGDKFGPTFATHVFRLDIVVPQSMRDEEVHLLWDSNSEALVLDHNGVPRQGLVGGDHWARRADYSLFPNSEHTNVPEEVKATVYIEIACNGLFGAGRGGEIEPPDMDSYYTLDECCIAVFNRKAWSLLHDLTLLSSLADQLPDGPRKTNALYVANDVVNAVRVDDPNTYEDGMKVAEDFLSHRNGHSQSVVHAMLHAHIDLAWLWPMASTPAKGARTFSTQLRLMDEYPDCIYVQSQAQLYSWVKERYPTLWTQLRDRVKDGRFVPVGATWVEMDCNLPSGESLVRQFFEGQKFFLENFGSHCNEFWLPDTFGYSAQLPQIMKGCGVDHFLTQKLSWNLFNKFPHSTFVWEGLDGSRVLAHMPPADTYNAQGFPEEVIRTAHKNKDCGTVNEAVMLVGHGDGGGGASPSMIESINRMKDLDGVPKVQFTTPAQFFELVKKKEDELPRWVGELYFELHRGTYTSQAVTKRDNRWCEALLRDAEAVSVLAIIAARSSGQEFKYPHGMLERCWRTVLKNCFHDTLPGSSIGMVYKETEEDYRFVKEECLKLIESALQSITCMTEQYSSNGHQTHANSNNYGLTGEVGKKELFVMERGTGWIEKHQKACVVEANIDIEESRKWIRQEPSFCRTSLEISSRKARQKNCLMAMKNRCGGWGIYSNPEMVSQNEVSEQLKVASVTKRSGPKGTEYVLRNGIVEATLAASGEVSSLVLISDGGMRREALATVGSKDAIGGNKFVVFDDVPQFWCGWDTEVYSFEKYEEVGSSEKCEILEEGPLRVALRFTYGCTYAGSTISQIVSLCANSARLDFTTEVNWKESRKILRVLFDTNIRSTYASYDSQFGFVRRPTTFNHSWEIAKFEVVGHQYCDLSEHGFGLAVLNDCKYGYSVRDSRMRLSLLRSAKSPDDNADVGVHRFTYSLLPHWKSFPTQEVIQEAAELNWPLHIWTSEVKGSRVQVDDLRIGVGCETEGELDSVNISAVKRADKDDGKIIVRLYESVGARGTARVKCGSGLDVDAVSVCNMLEGDERAEGSSAVRVDRGDVLIDIAPFQVRTLSIPLAPGKGNGNSLESSSS